MEKEKDLKEEKYNKSKKKIKKISIMVLIIGLIIGGSIISMGLKKQADINSKYSKESKQEIKEKLESEKANLEAKREELAKLLDEKKVTEKKKLEDKKKEIENKGITYSVFTSPTDGEKYDLKIITEVLTSDFQYCSFEEYKNHTLTSEYCKLVNGNDQDSKDMALIDAALNLNCRLSNDSLTANYCSYVEEFEKFNGIDKDAEQFDIIPYYMVGGFIIVAACFIAGGIYLTTKRGDMLEFSFQQVKPILEEGLELEKKRKIENLPTHCPHCGAPTNKKIVCEYCGCKIIK